MSVFIDFIQSNGLFFGLIVGTILIFVLIYTLFNRRFKEDYKSTSQVSQIEPSKDDSNHQPLEQEQKVSTISIPIVIDGEIITKPIVKEEQNILKEDSSSSSTEPSQPTQAPSSAPNQEMIPDEPIEEIVAVKVPKKPLGKYHVLFRQSDEKWIVKRENGERIIRVLETQKEAISFATIKALMNNTSIVIHKKDGKIRKQNYNKQAE
ncbi:MAG: DUF2188 domain-containing protein [Candidatus Izemoplasmatales bacterium]|jgi:hypothetical protein|nr:DUF2188 domain-containing protein [bacterium]MDZ4197359.1 DUF2188 domain-containing protein [Candidatus Izemoplasmatales bacterium]